MPVLRLFCFLVALLLGWQAIGANIVAGELTHEDMKFFEERVRPLLSQNCVSCHGPKKQEGGLRLDNFESFRAGGESGQLLSDKDIETSSLILKAVRREGPEMPPAGKLSDDKIEVLTEWVARGAPWPEHATAPLPSAKDRVREITPAEKSYWAYRPIQVSASLPIAKSNNASGGNSNWIVNWVKNPIDEWIAAKIDQADLKPAKPADRRILAKRLYLDLVGVLPTGEELASFLADESPTAYEQLVDKLLDDVRYGQRWGRHWLDLVRYADSDGFKQDAYRPTAYLYRDYVVQSFNSDKPYGQFLMEQIAGDELDPQNHQMSIATMYLRLWMYEYNQRDIRSQRSNILNDLTDVTGEVILGMGVGCARCHDHKFDPILQRDYYRLQAFFVPLIPRDDIFAAAPDEVARYHTELQEWNARTRSIREQLAAIEKPYRDQTIEAGIEKFPPDTRDGLRKAADERSPEEQQLFYLAWSQIERDLDAIDYKKKLTGSELQKWEQLREQLTEQQKTKPRAPPVASTMSDVGRRAPDVVIPGDPTDAVIEPGVPTIFDSGSLPIAAPENGQTTGRRTALAKWLTHFDNPLTWRVMANRVWQYHFGQGLVENSSDFGKLTAEPLHRELLDWLADDFRKHGSVKQLHRRIVTSATYQQSAYDTDLAAGMQADPLNRLHWRFQPRRMDAEQIRDSLLAAAHEIDWKSGGEAAEGEGNRRSVYLRVMRNNPNALLAIFDAPDGSSSIAKRIQTTTSLQSLFMLNSDWTVERAQQLANYIIEKSSSISSPAEHLAQAMQTVLLREPTRDEITQAMAKLHIEPTIKLPNEEPGESSELAKVAAMREYMKTPEYAAKLADWCHVLMNSNEFLLVE